MADRFNSEFLGSPNDKKINNCTLTKAVRQGEVGVSPKKMGRPSTIPAEFSLVCATHATTIQVSGGGRGIWFYDELVHSGANPWHKMREGNQSGLGMEEG